MHNIRCRNHISAGSRRASSAAFIVHVWLQYVKTDITLLLKIVNLVSNGSFLFRKMEPIFSNVVFAMSILLQISFSLLPSVVIRLPR